MNEVVEVVFMTKTDSKTANIYASACDCMSRKVYILE